MKVGDLVRHTADLEEIGIIFEVGFLPKSYMSVQAVRVQWTCGWSEWLPLCPPSLEVVSESR